MPRQIVWSNLVQFILTYFFKSKSYENNPQTIPSLKKEIQTVINNIQPDVFDRVMWKTASLDAVPPRDTICRMFFDSSIGNVTNYNQIF